MSTDPMTRHKIHNETYLVFEKSEKGRVYTLHFLWGKKDFRIYLGGQGEAPGDHNISLATKEGSELAVLRLEYLNNYEWLVYDGVGGHGLAHEEVRWRQGGQKRYVELPKDFLDVAVQLACLEFDLERQSARKAS